MCRISIDVRTSVAHIALNHPPLNIIDFTMMEELTQSLVDVNEHSEISVLLIRGEGKTFSAGVDVAAHTPDKVELMLTKFHAVIRALVASKKVTVAAVQGNCLGGGAELAMVCDLVYTTESAQWGFPEISLGCFPPVACTALAALIGQKRAAELILTGRTITGREAADIGLATHAVAEEKLQSATEATIGQFSRLSSASLALTKKAIYAWDSMHFDKGLARAERIYLEELIKSTDTQEGTSAFLQKREPRWKGQ